MSESIFSRRVRIDGERRDKMREAMQDYDEVVYYPAKKALQDECGQIGHKPNGHWDTMVSGLAYQHCGNCGVTLYEDDMPHRSMKPQGPA